MMNEPKIYRTKDISKLKQKAEATGDEKLPVSKNEYITVAQISKRVQKDMSETMQEYVKKTDFLVIDGGSPVEMANNN